MESNETGRAGGLKPNEENRTPIRLHDRSQEELLCKVPGEELDTSMSEKYDIGESDVMSFFKEKV